MKKYSLLLMIMVLSACSKNEMKMARNAVSIHTSLKAQSPIYIQKKAGQVQMNESNRIGNTDWVLSVDRDLTVGEIAPFLQKLVLKKYDKDGMHTDHKSIFWVYSDTLHQQNAYVSFPFTQIKDTIYADQNSFLKLQTKEELLKNTEVSGYSAVIVAATGNIENFVAALIALETQGKPLPQTLYVATSNTEKE